jgi:hypothetical protein
MQPIPTLRFVMVASAAIAMLGCVRRSPDLRGDIPVHLNASQADGYRLLLAMVRAAAEPSPVRLCSVHIGSTLGLSYADVQRLGAAVGADRGNGIDWRCPNESATLSIGGVLVRGDTAIAVAGLSARYQAPSRPCTGSPVAESCSTPDSARNQRWLSLQTCFRAERKDGVWRIKERRAITPNRPMSTEDVLGCSTR